MKLKITLFLFATTLYFGQIFAQDCNTDYEEVNGIAIIEAESKIAGSWSLRNLSGASGGQALYYAGSNQFNNPGTSAITYTLRVNNPGLYRVQLRSQIGVISTGPEAPTSEHNDTWLKINGAEFYGQNGNSIVWPRGSGRTPIVAGSSGDGWLKAYTNQLGWTWNTFTNDGPGHSIYVRFNSAGTYNVQISGRSKDHIVDRIVLYQQALYSTSQATDLSRAETACGSVTPPPPANVAPTVSITSPSNGQSFNEGSNITVNLNSNDSDGNIVSHEIFINNASVDSDGANYTPHVITNAQPGTYNIRAVVTDNDGATASSSVSITVNEDVPPPPPANVAPTVSIASPSNGQSFNEGSNITVNLNSNDSDGSVVSHEIFINNVSVDVNGSSYEPYVITNAQPGTYSIRAVVTDDDGASASGTISITVNGDVPPPPSANIAPAIGIISPSNGQSFEAGSNITVNLGASDSDGSIVRYEIFINNVSVDSDGASYTPHVITNAQPGTYSIRAEVTDDDGAKASGTISITVNEDVPPPPVGNVAPTFEFTTLSNGQEVIAGSVVTIGVTANDSDGSVEQYQIFVNDALVDTDPATFTPYSIVNIASGSYEIKVIVTDNEGATFTDSIKITATTASSTNDGINLYLIDAVINSRIIPILDGGSLDASQTVDSNIQAETPEGTESVRFQLSGSSIRTHVENYIPYALFRDIEGDYYKTTLSNGSYTLNVKAYDDNFGRGNIIAEETFSFTITGSSAGKVAIAFPNPVKEDGKVSIRFPEGTQGNFDYIVTNSLGAIVDKGTFAASRSERNIDLELSSVGRQTDGVYFLNLISPEFTQSIPIIRK